MTNCDWRRDVDAPGTPPKSAELSICIGRESSHDPLTNLSPSSSPNDSNTNTSAPLNVPSPLTLPEPSISAAAAREGAHVAVVGPNLVALWPTEANVRAATFKVELATKNVKNGIEKQDPSCEDHVSEQEASTINPIIATSSSLCGLNVIAFDSLLGASHVLTASQSQSRSLNASHLSHQSSSSTQPELSPPANRCMGGDSNGSGARREAWVPRRRLQAHTPPPPTFITTFCPRNRSFNSVEDYFGFTKELKRPYADEPDYSPQPLYIGHRALSVGSHDRRREDTPQRNRPHLSTARCPQISSSASITFSAEPSTPSPIKRGSSSKLRKQAKSNSPTNSPSKKSNSNTSSNANKKNEAQRCAA